MQTPLLVLWIIGVTSFSLLGSFYARRTNKSDLLIGLYIAFILTAQMLATKIASFDIFGHTFVGPAGVIVFAVTFLLTDIVNEKFGRKETQRMIMIAFFAQVAMTFFLYLGTKFPPAPDWSATLGNAWNTFFSMTPRIALASWTAFLVSENVDAYVFSWFKKLTHGHMLWLRNVVSTLPALALDSLIFIPLAFWGGGFPLVPLMIGQISIKWLVGVVNIPFIYLNRSVIEGGR